MIPLTIRQRIRMQIRSIKCPARVANQQRDLLRLGILDCILPRTAKARGFGSEYGISKWSFPQISFVNNNLVDVMTLRTKPESYTQINVCGIALKGEPTRHARLRYK